MGQRVGYFRRLLPFLFALGLILFNAVPAYPLNGYFQSIPLVLIVIFYFAVFHPSALNDGMVFGLSIFADILVQSPFGLVIITYVLMFFVSHFLRSYLVNLNFFRLWGVFGFFTCSILSIQYVLFCLIQGQWMLFMPNMIGVIALILLYPFIIQMCAMIDAYVRKKA